MEIPLGHRISSFVNRRQDQQRFLDIGREHQEVHDLTVAGEADQGQAGTFGRVFGSDFR